MAPRRGTDHPPGTGVLRIGDRPPFIVLEGGEGSGKSTQARLLGEWLGARGIPNVVAREPGGTPVGEAIREVVLHRTDLDMAAESELLMILAARATYVREVVRPALGRGEAVISDRYRWSSLAYQGYGRGLDLDTVRELNEFATGGLVPDLYVVLDVSVEEGERRQRAQGKKRDRFEGSGLAFLERVRAGYREMAAADPAAHVLDASGDPEEIQSALRELVSSLFPELAGEESL